MGRFGVATGLVAFLASTLVSCTGGSDVPGRYTYIVRYAVTATDTPVVTYLDATGVPVAFAGPFPRSVEVTMDYDYASPFIPEMTGTSGGLPFTMAISWRDYATGFAVVLLAEEDVGAGQSATLTGPQLPP